MIALEPLFVIAIVVGACTRSRSGLDSVLCGSVYATRASPGRA